MQSLEFEDKGFSIAVSFFVFCSVPELVQGSLEIERVCIPPAKAMLLEHLLSASRILALLIDLANQLAVRLIEANIKRKAVPNVVKSGLMGEQGTDLPVGILKLIEARKKALFL